MAEINWSLAQIPDYFQGAVQSQQAGEARRIQQAKAAAYQQYAADPVNGLQAVLAADPAAGVQLRTAAAQAERQAAQDQRQARIDAQPKFMEGPDGIYALDPATGQNHRVADYPKKEPSAPSGYAWADPNNTALKYIQGGPGDPATIGGIAQTRRDVVVKNPLPSRARAGGGSGGTGFGGGGGSFGAWGLSPEEDVALSAAVGEGRLDAKGLNSRTAKINARILLANPGVNLMDVHGQANMKSNATVQQRNINLNSLEETLANVRDAGKRLNFSDFKPLGTLQSGVKAMSNDPDYQDYIVQRNDAVQVVANAMRGIGMSDHSIKLEEEAAHKAMSPRAFEAWYQGQMKALRPRLERNAAYTVQPLSPGARPAPAATTPATAPRPPLSAFQK